MSAPTPRRAGPTDLAVGPTRRSGAAGPRPRELSPAPLRTATHSELPSNEYLRPSPLAGAAGGRGTPAVNATQSTTPAGEAGGKEENQK
jgi:hypothetical protein